MLPAFADLSVARHGSLSEAADYLAQLLSEAAPGVEIVAIARRPGVLSKVAVIGELGGDAVATVREQLDGERIDVVPWSAEPRRYITDALGMSEMPPIVLKPLISHAQVLVGEIDLRGMNGWRGLNRLLASSLTGWRIHLETVASSSAWALLSAARADQRSVLATIVELTPRRARVEVHGLYAWLPQPGQLAVGQELQVRITRLDPDEGRISASRRLTPTGQLSLPG
ncbi:MAG TPA: hypothetical protein VGL99_12680 [Chloroflexota bacterium]